MRRASVTLLAFLLLAAVSVASGSASSATTGTAPFELRNGNGRAVITTAARGSVIISVRQGRVRIVQRPGARRAKYQCNRAGRRLSSVALEFRGRNVRCLVWGSWRWQVIVNGRGINAPGKIRGSLTLDAFNAGRTGTYRIKNRPFRAWPRSPRSFWIAR